jgi:hypothetical protein
VISMNETRNRKTDQSGRYSAPSHDFSKPLVVDGKDQYDSGEYPDHAALLLISRTLPEAACIGNLES